MNQHREGRHPFPYHRDPAWSWNTQILEAKRVDICGQKELWITVQNGRKRTTITYARPEEANALLTEFGVQTPEELTQRAVRAYYTTTAIERVYTPTTLGISKP
ncbi:hypothetical protein HY489_00580 [Candidatus Woesearchaeota archaeon]|nr:hypothetical protein [Candidatus Woesearchaeota archaeon]